MSLDAVLKVGGSLNRGTSLSILCQEISRLGERFSLLVVPGGGEFADQVRKAYRRYDLDETTAHSMALLAMDQFGYLLNRLIAGSSLMVDLISASRAAESGRVVILLPSSAVIQADALPHSWQVTSDTIAAWVAQQTNCRLLVLLKDVDGLLTAEYAESSGGDVIKELTVEQLAEHTGGVDDYLSRFLPFTRMDTWVINGLWPERLSELLYTTHTTGTHITPAAGVPPTSFDPLKG